MVSIDGVPQTSMDLIRIILVNQMNMDPQFVNIYDNKWVVPNIEDMFITVEYRNGKTIANNSVFVNDSPTSTPTECQVVNMFEKIVVGVFSRNQEAQLRKEEVLMSIRSQYAQLMQETWAIRIAQNADIEDLSALEGTAMLKRYDIELNVWAWYVRKITPGYLNPPMSLLVKANDQGAGLLEAQVTASSQLPLL